MRDADYITRSARDVAGDTTGVGTKLPEKSQTSLEEQDPEPRRERRRGDRRADREEAPEPDPRARAGQLEDDHVRDRADDGQVPSERRGERGGEPEQARLGEVRDPLPGEDHEGDVRDPRRAVDPERPVRDPRRAVD